MKAGIWHTMRSPSCFQYITTESSPHHTSLWVTLTEAAYTHTVTHTATPNTPNYAARSSKHSHTFRVQTDYKNVYNAPRESPRAVSVSVSVGVGVGVGVSVSVRVRVSTPRISSGPVL